MLGAAIRGLSESHAFTVLDVGNEMSGPAREALELADQVVVVTTPSADAVDIIRLALARCGSRNPTSSSPPIFAIVCRRPQRRSVLRRLHSRLDGGLSRAVVVPHDRNLGSAGSIALNNHGPETRHAYLELAALIANSHDD
jgi:MinD-like ATPase involved in chromosome partitioning or flagellar assembly